MHQAPWPPAKPPLPTPARWQGSHREAGGVWVLPRPQLPALGPGSLPRPPEEPKGGLGCPPHPTTRPGERWPESVRWGHSSREQACPRGRRRSSPRRAQADPVMRAVSPHPQGHWPTALAWALLLLSPRSSDPEEAPRTAKPWPHCRQRSSACARVVDGTLGSGLKLTPSPWAAVGG